MELVSGSRVLVGSDLPDVAGGQRDRAAVARDRRDRPDGMFETQPGSGCIVRGSAIIAIKAQRQEKKGVAESLLKTNTRPGTWL